MAFQGWLFTAYEAGQRGIKLGEVERSDTDALRTGERNSCVVGNCAGL